MRALLLLGPTGSGKTPLGRRLAEKGWAGRRVFHFDNDILVLNGLPRHEGQAERMKDLAEVRRKLQLYERRTKPLIGYYAAQGVPVLRLRVGAADAGDDIYRALRAHREVDL